ncbi:MAG: dihydrofolate reductase family protein [Verrucomicrobia bacterium]|nr:dihydrofolate reductase family protein [Verrucomicrobiota bacterium]
MRKVSLYIASSLDGYIARKDGAIDWLPPITPAEDYGYGAFFSRIDTVLLGRKTYELSLTFSGQPYEGRRCVVFTHTPLKWRDPHAEFVSDDIAGFVRALRAEPGRDIWLVGGAEIVAACLAGRVVDEIILTVVPVLLGEGIPLFPPGAWGDQQLRLRDTRGFSTGLVQMTYDVLPAG